MTRTLVRRAIAAPPERVFAAVSELESLPEVVPNILRVEILEATDELVGTRFRETRSMGKSESVTDLEVTECVPNEYVRMVADSHGTVWDSVFRVRAVPGGSELELVMDARAHKWLPKILNPLMKGLIRKGLESHMDAVKAWCERS